MNEIKLSGSVKRIYPMFTKRGETMSKILLAVPRAGTFWVIGFGPVAEAINDLEQGSKLQVKK